MLNVCCSRHDSEIDHILDSTVSTLVSGWFVDSDASLSSSDSNDKIYRPYRKTEFSAYGKGQMAMQGKIILSLNIGDGDDGIQVINSAKSWVFFAVFQKIKSC